MVADKQVESVKSGPQGEGHREKDIEKDTHAHSVCVRERERERERERGTHLLPRLRSLPVVSSVFDRVLLGARSTFLFIIIIFFFFAVE